jgi:hypothetical protein
VGVTGRSIYQREKSYQTRRVYATFNGVRVFLLDSREQTIKGSVSRVGVPKGTQLNSEDISLHDNAIIEESFID